MIVEPDFLTHWKTQLLIAELGDIAAPLYVISLWAHCQQRRTDTFSGLSDNALKAICRFPGEAAKLRQALASAGFIVERETGFTVHGWAEVNGKLLANWDNGGKGGRPRKSRVGSGSENPPETQTKPTENPSPENGNPQGTDKRRVDKSREDNTPLPPFGDAEEPPLCSIEQARAHALMVRMSPAAVDFWWHQRNAAGWRRGGAGNPRITSWQSDMATSAQWAEDGARKSVSGEHKPKPTVRL